MGMVSPPSSGLGDLDVRPHGTFDALRVAKPSDDCLRVAARRALSVQTAVVPVRLQDFEPGEPVTNRPGGRSEKSGCCATHYPWNLTRASSNAPCRAISLAVSSSSNATVVSCSERRPRACGPL